MNNKTILIDPMLGIDAAPIAPFKIKRYNDVSLDLINDLPDIDLMILSQGFYWTAIAWVKQIFLIQAGVKSEPFDVGTHGMLAFVFLFSLWGSWYLYKNRNQFF